MADKSPFWHAKSTNTGNLLFATRDFLFIIPLLPKLRESNQSAEAAAGNFGDQSQATNKE